MRNRDFIIKIGVMKSNLDFHQENGEIILYQPNEALQKIEVKIINDTVWLSLSQMVELFERDKSVISRHIRNIFKEGELNTLSTVANFATVQNERGRLVERQIEHYSLDVIISV